MNYIDSDGELPLPAIAGVGNAFIGAVFRVTDYIERQTEAGKKVNPWEVAKAALSGAMNGGIRGLAAGSNLLSALSDMVGLIGNVITRAAYDKINTGKVDFFNIAREALYDRYGGRPKPEQTGSVAENAKDMVRPATIPSTTPGISSRDPRAGCSGKGKGSGYGYDYGTSNFLKTTPSLSERLKARWSDPTNLINDATTAISLVGFGVTGIKATSNFMKKGSSAIGKSGRNAKEIYRAVSPEEFDDIFATRGFRQKPNGRSFQVKEFGNSLAETIDFANQPINVDKAAIVGVKIPKNMYNQLNHMNLDRRFFKSGTPVVEPEMLDAFNRSIIDIKHVF